MRFKRLATTTLCAVTMTACSAPVERSGHDGSNQVGRSEATDRTTEALNPNCTSQVVGVAGVDTNMFELGGATIPIPIVKFFGWCFNGGETLSVFLYDATTGVSVASTTTQAGPDGNSSTWFPGSISGEVGFGIGGSPVPPPTDQLEFVAFDFNGESATSSCFTLGWSTQTSSYQTSGC